MGDEQVYELECPKQTFIIMYPMKYEYTYDIIVYQ